MAHRPCPPCELTAALEFLLPKVLTALMYWFWDHLKKDEIVLNESKAPMLFFLHRLHSCGWVTQKLMADALTDPEVYSQLVKGKCVCKIFKLIKSPVTQLIRTLWMFCLHLFWFILCSGIFPNDARFWLETSCTQAYKAFGMLVEHTTLLDAFLFTSIKLRFPEGLNTLLIGLLAVTEFKVRLHFSRIKIMGTSFLL